MGICYWYSFTSNGFSWAFLCCFSRRICQATWKYTAPYFPQHNHKNYLFNQRENSKNMFFLKWGQKGKDWIKKWISVSRSVATFWPSLIFYSKIRAFFAGWQCWDKNKRRHFRSKWWEELKLGYSVTWIFNSRRKQSRLASGKKFVSLIENILDCITTT